MCRSTPARTRPNIHDDSELGPAAVEAESCPPTGPGTKSRCLDSNQTARYQNGDGTKTETIYLEIENITGHIVKHFHRFLFQLIDIN